MKLILFRRSDVQFKFETSNNRSCLQKNEPIRKLFKYLNRSKQLDQHNICPILTSLRYFFFCVEEHYDNLVIMGSPQKLHQISFEVLQLLLLS